MRKHLIAAFVLVSLVASAGCGGGGDRQEIVAEFADVGDLVIRANVQQSDAVVGSVRSIDLVERNGAWIARVAMRVEPDTRLTKGTKAIVRSTSLLGEKYVDLVPTPGGGPELGEREVIGVKDTAKAPELEAVFSQLGGILQSGGLEDLARITSASAMILEGQEETVGRVLDQAAKLVGSLSAQRDALASGLDDLATASKVLSDNASTLDRALVVSDDALGIVASQQAELEELVIQLDRLGKPLGELTRAHKGDIDAQVRALNVIVPRLHQVRATLEDAVTKLPKFTQLFARSAPGDYFQLDVFAEALPIGTATASRASGRGVFADLLMEATR